MELEESTYLTSDYATKLQPSRQYGTGMKMKSESEVAQSCPTLSTPWTAAYQAPPSMGFARQEYWCGVSLPSKRDVLSTVLYRRRSLETTLKIRLIRCPYVCGFISGFSILFH